MITARNLARRYGETLRLNRFQQTGVIAKLNWMKQF